jgi:hypothetical protein
MGLLSGAKLILVVSSLDMLSYGMCIPVLRDLFSSGGDPSFFGVVQVTHTNPPHRTKSSVTDTRPL